MNEFGCLRKVAIRTAKAAFVSSAKTAREWEALRFHAEPDVVQAEKEYLAFHDILTKSGAELIELPAADHLTLDAIYPRDAHIITEKGLILCHMGRASRQSEVALNANEYASRGIEILAQIELPGSLEGGDFIWLDDTAAAVGLGPRTNSEGIKQLAELLGPGVDLHSVPLPTPEHPDDVFHLMSMISPLDGDLALIYRPLMPPSFLDWLGARGLNFVEVPEDEFESMGCNVLALGPRHVVMLDQLPKTKALLENAGCRVETFKGDEISRKGEGGPTCLTRPLVRGSVEDPGQVWQDAANDRKSP